MADENSDHLHIHRTNTIPNWIYDPNEVVDKLYEFKIGDDLPPENGHGFKFGVECWGIKRKHSNELVIFTNTHQPGTYVLTSNTLLYHAQDLMIWHIG